MARGAREGAAETRMRGLKLDSGTDLIQLNDSFTHFLRERFGRRFAPQFQDILNDILDTGDLHSLDDMKKVIRYYEWRERAARQKAEQWKTYAGALEGQLRLAQDQLTAARRTAAIPKAVATAIPVAPTAQPPADLPRGSMAAAPPAEAELDLEASVVERREPIRKIVSKIEQVKSLSALSSDAEIDGIFSDLEA